MYDLLWEPQVQGYIWKGSLQESMLNKSPAVTYYLRSQGTEENIQASTNTHPPWYKEKL